MSDALTEDAVRAEVRAWLDANWDPELGLVEWRNRLIDSGWGVPHWPKAWYGRDLPTGAGAGGGGGVRAHRRGRRRHRRHPPPGRRDHPRARHGCAEGEVPAPQPDRRGHLVPAVQRAGQRLGRRRRGHPRRVQGQPLGDQRPEGMDHHRAPCRLGAAAGAHRLGRAEAPGAVLFRHRHAPARRRGAAAAADERPRLVQPGLHHRCRGAARESGRRGRRRLGGDDHDPDARAARRRRIAQRGQSVRPARAAATRRSARRSPPRWSHTNGIRSGAGRVDLVLQRAKGDRASSTDPVVRQEIAKLLMPVQGGGMAGAPCARGAEAGQAAGAGRLAGQAGGEPCRARGGTGAHARSPAPMRMLDAARTDRCMG